MPARPARVRDPGGLPATGNPLVQPIVKWAGGKRQLIRQIRKHVPKQYNRYFEPFLGGGAVLFSLQPQRASVNDANGELVNLYNVVRDMPDALIHAVKAHRYEEAYYYDLRAQDREEDFSDRPALERAARILFLNKTCFNGLFRVNSHGQFNVPFGNYTNPSIADSAVIHAVSQYLCDSEIALTNLDFEEAVHHAGAGDFVYLDPPYDPLSDTASFTGYSVGSFGKDQQKRLRRLCAALTARGCHWLLSNSSTPFIRQLYADCHITEVEAGRNISAAGAGRQKICELLIANKL